MNTAQNSTQQIVHVNDEHPLEHVVLPYNWDEIPFTRTMFIQQACDVINAQNYLEIGCCTDSNFNEIKAPNKVGVDPEIGGTLRMTSNVFFADNQQKFDVIFIDGLHLYHQVHRDIVNATKCLKPGGFILLHDLVPLHWRHEHVPRISEYWNGDVWKVSFEVQKTPGMQFKIMLAECGVGVIKLNDDYREFTDLSNELTNQRFAYFYERYKTLPLMEPEEGLEWIKNV